jgi:monoterpene epsilon-lactone hydrolase
LASAELKTLIGSLAEYPESADLAEERRAWDATCAPLEPLGEVAMESVEAGGVPALLFEPPTPAALQILYFHGGAFALGSSWHNRGMLSRLAWAASARVIGVDYRLAPEARFPAALEDATAAYRWAVERGESSLPTVVAGDSCGANLALGAVLAARDAGCTPLAALVCLSPWVDLTLAGRSFEENADLDPFITRESLAWLAAEYLDGADPAGPGASPLFADLSGLPPILIQVGAGEVLSSDAMELARRAAAAGVAVTLELVPEVVHVWQVWAGEVPESAAAVRRIATFLEECARMDADANPSTDALDVRP